MSPHHLPRPILKRNTPPSKQAIATLPFPACGPIHSPHVHFPPTPGLTSTHAAYSPQTYDRAPILVSPNACELPERHERKVCSPQTADFEIEHADRGRSRKRTKGENLKGSYFHPRAYEACEPEPMLNGSTASLSLPPLVHDASPPEDDMIVTPPDHYPSSSAWITKQSEDIPLLPDVYVSSPVYTVQSTRREAAPWESSMEGKKQRPNLKRMAHRPSVKRVGFSPEFSPYLDEGCLGGF